MAKGKKTGGKNFEKGNKHSLGRPKLPEELRGVALLSKDHLKRTIFKYLDMSPIQLQDIYKEVNTIKAVDLIIIKFIFEALKGDHYKAEWLMVRSIGRVSEDSEEDSNKTTAHSQLIEYIKARQTDIKTTE